MPEDLTKKFSTEDKDGVNDVIEKLRSLKTNPKLAQESYENIVLILGNKEEAYLNNINALSQGLDEVKSEDLSSSMMFGLAKTLLEFERDNKSDLNDKYSTLGIFFDLDLDALREKEPDPKKIMEAFAVSVEKIGNILSPHFKQDSKDDKIKKLKNDLAMVLTKAIPILESCEQEIKKILHFGDEVSHEEIGIDFEDTEEDSKKKKQQEDKDLKNIEKKTEIKTSENTEAAKPVEQKKKTKEEEEEELKKKKQQEEGKDSVKIESKGAKKEEKSFWQVIKDGASDIANDKAPRGIASLVSGGVATAAVSGIASVGAAAAAGPVGLVVMFLVWKLTETKEATKEKPKEKPLELNELTDYMKEVEKIRQDLRNSGVNSEQKNLDNKNIPTNKNQSPPDKSITM